MIPKFRAWHEEKKRMYDVIKIETRTFDENLMLGLVELNTLAGFLDNVPSETIELMQWTGLQDRNGKDIYEGDFLEHANNTFVVPSIFPLGRENEVEMIKSWSTRVRDFRDHDTTDWISWSTDDWEIIGNIYSNPELLVHHD